MFDFQKYTRQLLRLILRPQDRQQSLSLETNPVCDVVQCFPHDNIVRNRLCDECKKSALLIVCHMLESILWLISQACWPTTECQVVQFLPRTSISRQPVSKLLTILQLIQVLPCLNWWSSKQGLETLKNCSTLLFANSQYHSTHFWACPSMS